MTRPLRIGVQLQPQHADIAQICDAVRQADGVGGPRYDLTLLEALIAWRDRSGPDGVATAR